MVTTIRTTCPSCGEVDLIPDDIELHIVRSGADAVAAGSTYAFACPACAEVVTKPADERIARLLATGGVRVSIQSDALSAGHPESPPPGAAFTYDDLLDFHLLLSREDWHLSLALA